MRIALCDDDRRERELFLHALHGWDPTQQPECFSDGASFLEAARMEPPFDIAFLDIYMPGEDGMDVAGALREISPETGVVFVTISEAHAVDAFSLHALHYLVKPVTTEGVAECFRRLTQIQTKKRRELTLSSGRESRTVYQDEILYIQSDRHAKEIHLTGGRRIRVWISMEELEEKLDGTFLRLGRSAIVNMEQIEQMGTESCLLRNGIRLEFSRRERAAVRAAYDNYLFARLSRQGGFGGGG
ncbi:MAG: LytTR family DNA-binding domain-containing protein [Eubacteriales bacterium]|nr:LytTR family DNA-binding domain-containing protein [Eubacteriales bacterium]